MISGAFCRSARGWNGKCKTGSFYEAFWNKWCEGGSKPRSDCRSCTKTRYELGDSNKGHRCGRTGYSDVGQHAQPVSYTHLRAHETKANLVCRLLLEKKKNTQ